MTLRKTMQNSCGKNVHKNKTEIISK